MSRFNCACFEAFSPKQYKVLPHSCQQMPHLHLTCVSASHATSTLMPANLCDFVSNSRGMSTTCQPQTSSRT